MSTSEQAPDALDLAKVEQHLRAELDSISAAIAELTKPPASGSALAFGKRIGEGTTEAISRFTDVGVANDLQAIRVDTERALEKIEQGTYGICDNCGQPIAGGRLRAAPASALCVECARAAG